MTQGKLFQPFSFMLLLFCYFCYVLTNLYPEMILCYVGVPQVCQKFVLGIWFMQSIFTPSFGLSF